MQYASILIYTLKKYAKNLELSKILLSRTPACRFCTLLKYCTLHIKILNAFKIGKNSVFQRVYLCGGVNIPK